MRNPRLLLTVSAFLGWSLLLDCTHKQPAPIAYQGSYEIQPLLKLAKSLDIDEIAWAEALVTAEEIDGQERFELLVDKSRSMLYGTLRLPKRVSSCDVTIRIYDAQDRKIGERGAIL